MTCCNTSVSYECCYPDECSCCAGCIACACCGGSDCSSCPEVPGPICGPGGCCTCDSNHWGYAWKQACPCGLCPGCGDDLYFSTNCSGGGGSYYVTGRVDTHNPNASTTGDLTKAFFTNFAPLSQGIITGMRISDNATCC